MKEQGIELMIFDLLKITYDDLKDSNNEEIAIKCAQRAYLDFCRTLTYDESFKEDESRKDEFKSDINKWISKKVITDLFDNLIDDFDNWHKKICNEIINKSKNLNVELFYGQAQKWLNMTIKYLWILDIQNSNFNKNIKNCHIPVDNIILRAVGKKEGWSRWDYDEYTSFQKEIKKEFAGQFPLEWENKTWIKESGKSFK